jgi:RNA polymerase sigma-70 factor (ECF subfamily)
MRLTLVGRTGRRKIAEPARGSGERRDIPFSERAFEDLYRDTFGSVWSIARRAARDDMEADDVAQLAYLAVYRYWSKGELREPPAHLLYRVAKRGAIDLLRGHRRSLRLFARLPRPAPVQDVAGPLDRALRRLRPADAALVLMQAAAGFSYEELAAIEGKSVSSIRSRLFRARRELARHYDDEGGTW